MRSGLAFIAGRYARYLALVDRQPRRVACLLLVACLPLALCAAIFFSEIRAGLEDLLPADSPAVRAIEVIHERFAGRANLIVIATSPDRAENRRFIATLGARLAQARVPEVRLVQTGCKEERQWLIDHAALLMPDDTFAAIADEADAAIASAREEASPFFLGLDEPPRGDAERWRPVLARLDVEMGEQDRLPTGWFEGEDGRMVLAVVWLEGSETERGPADRLLRAVQREVDLLRPQLPADLRVSYAGEVMNLIEQHDAIVADLALSSAIVSVLVGLLIIAYFRSLRALAVVLCGLLPGLLLTFAIGLVAIGHINSNTGFLGSIIAGNGINYPILFLAYYRAEGPRAARREALQGAARRSLPGTLGAAVTAAAAYGVLAVSTFRGFSQFGWLGGAGILCVWLCTYLATPIAIALLDPARGAGRPTTTQTALARFFAYPRRPLIVAGAFLAGSLAVAGVGVRFAQVHGLYDLDLRNLTSRESQRSGSNSWGPRVGEVFGIWLSATTAVVDDPADRPALAAALDEALFERPPRLGARLSSIDQLAPPLATQERRIERLRRIAAALVRVPRERIPARARPLLDAWLAEDNLHPIESASVPPALTANLAERDGRMDRTILVFPRHDIDFNDASNVIRFADRIHEARLPPGATVGGSFLLMAEVFRVVSSEAPRMVLMVCLLVAALLVPIFARRPARIPFVVLVVALVAAISQAQMLALGVQINMINFAAVPITIGVGADYLINLFGAMDAFRQGARQACARMGGAILLCSLTTMVGYASLIFAESGALRTFGWAAALGELMAVTTVLLVVPALWPGARNVLLSPAGR